jgi:SAM-dependent methyltransferase
MSEDSESIVAHGYDAVYRAVPNSPTLWRIWQHHAVGVDYPDAYGHISFVALEELRAIGAALHLDDTATLVDLACGMGGPSLWLITRFGGRVVGVDASTVAVTASAARAATLGLADRSDFGVGTFADTKLDAEVGDALVSFDAIQYAPSKAQAFAEMARVIRAGGRVAFTAFEVVAERVANVPVLGDDPIDDYRPLLRAAGFTIDSYDETPGWQARVTNAFQAIIDSAATLEAEMGGEAYGSLALEAALTLDLRPYRRRITAIATRELD